MRQEGYITDQELTNALKKKIDDSSTNSTLSKQQVGDLSSLKTTSKSTLVGAINEVKDGIGTVVNNTLGSAELTTKDKTIKGAINEVKDGISSVVNNTLGNATLNTSDKTIKGAINEAFQFANDGKSAIASVIGSPTANNNTFNEMKNNIQNCKGTLAANLNNKGVGALSSEALTSLVAKVANITADSLGAIKMTSDRIALAVSERYRIIDIGFTPNLVITNHDGRLSIVTINLFGISSMSITDINVQGDPGYRPSVSLGPAPTEIPSTHNMATGFPCGGNNIYVSMGATGYLNVSYWAFRI